MTPTTEQLKDLHDALDEIDRLIEAVEAGDDAAFRRYNRAVFATPAQDVGLQLREDDSYRAYRDSIDAAVALLEALLPGWGWHCGVYGARVWEYPGDEWNRERHQDVEMPFSPARALLLATLRAYRSTREGVR